jgi:protein-tyrosine phosphatase
VLDLHCHILPGVDDGAADLAAAVLMGRRLAHLGFTAVAPSPHYGGGPGGDVAPERATEVRADLARALAQAGIELELLANAEHHVTMEMYARVDAAAVVPLGGASKWLLVELPWRAIPNVEEALFRLQAKGFRLLLAHPERYTYLELDVIERLVARDVKLQLELGSFVEVYGKRAKKHALALAESGSGHVLATDLHRPEDAETWLPLALAEVRKRFGQPAVTRALDDNPRALVADAPATAVPAFVAAS